VLQKLCSVAGEWQLMGKVVVVVAWWSLSSTDAYRQSEQAVFTLWVCRDVVDTS